MNNAIEFPPVCVQALEQYLRPDLFKALCDPTRLSIVAYLATQKQPSSVSKLAELYGIDFSGVSRHLKLLKEADVVVAQKQGREVKYSLNSTDLIETMHGFANALEVCCKSAD